MNTPDILVVGLSLALQRTLEFDVVRPGEVNRARRVTQTASGKGANVARVLTALGARPTLIGFNGGDTGRAVETDLIEAQIACRLISTVSPTRICQTLVDTASGQVTELVEESAMPTPGEWAALQAVFESVLTETKWLILTGTLIPGAPADLYARLAEQAGGQDIPWLIDSQQDALTASLKHRPFVAKLNEEELAATCGKPIANQDDLIASARSLLDAGAQNVLVTRGTDDAWLITRDSAISFQPPPVTAVNPIGSGDAVMAGLAHALSRGKALDDAVRLGMACGAANAVTRWPGYVEPSIIAHVLR